MNKFVVLIASIARILVKPFFPVKVIGPRKLPKRKTLLVGNHISGWDPVVYTMWSKTWLSFVYKAEFDRSAVLNWVFKGLDFVPVHRGEVDLAATKAILKNLHDDKIVGLFPEGTRNPRTDCLQPFHTGAAMFALKTHSPVRPFCIWDKSKAFHKNYILIGDEFTLDEFYGKPLTKEVLAEATEHIRCKVDELRIRLDETLAKKGKRRRKLSKKEVEKINRYNQKQKTQENQFAANEGEGK
ncbi:MAG: 1-acyl-sn-glycerol-3-phosphate acyltransferase [Corallococcus sp.]|nr:1-acyl-sn-glycerol-3-phosphate acyltransferase [Corallococcus sp.]MCM1359682.1 1-acyl-sn-glycerol-3-phosphate acyltransferase [Corallococcus sp.]MCM1395391.1 1-acyl-sn-glycerol-3-phosphate acyltransferase [Corallococcus sp.]